MTEARAEAEPTFGFGLEASQNKYLAEGEGELTAIISLTATGVAAPPELAVVVLVDCSGSMNAPQTKISAARRATVAALDVVPDGSAFAVVQGTQHAVPVYPRERRLAVASPETRAEAQRAVRHLAAAGGTVIGNWLRLAGELLDTRATGVRHAILLTDGRNQHEQRADLDRVLAACLGRFSCDVRAIGDGWEPAEVLRIAAALGGTAEEVREAELADDFRAMIDTATGKVVPDLRLTVRTTVPTARILSFRKVVPSEADLTADAVAVDERTSEFALGSWGAETADYELTLTVDPSGYRALEDIQVALVGLRPVGAGDVPVGEPVPVLAHWTDDPVKPTWVHPKQSQVLDQDELRQAVNAGCQAYELQDHGRAAVEWGRAARLAHDSDNRKVLRRLEKLVHIDDPETGAVRIRPDINRRALSSMILDAQSTVQGPGRAGEPMPAAVPQPAGPDRSCPDCGYLSPGTARICTRCGLRLVGP
jgi:hypothetical protein